MKKHTLIKFALLYISLILFIVCSGPVFSRKSITDVFANTYRLNGFYNEPKNTVDMLFVGSSHSYTSVNPSILSKDYGVEAYNFSSALQPIEISYYFVLEALKTQKPDFVFLETYMIDQTNEYQEVKIRNAIDTMPMSLNKFNLIRDLVPYEEHAYYLFPTLKYHSRWNELKISDFDNYYKNETHELKGHVALEGKPQAEFANHERILVENYQLNQKDLNYIDKLIKLSREEDFELVLFTAPYKLTDKTYTIEVLLEDYALENELQYINLNRNLQSYNLNTDFYDEGHLSKSGALIATQQLIEQLDFE